jgi:hypothetical protein
VTEATLEEASGVIANGYLRLDPQEWVRAAEKQQILCTRPVLQVSGLPGSRLCQSSTLRLEVVGLLLGPQSLPAPTGPHRGGTAFIEATRGPDYESFPGSSSRWEESVESSPLASISGRGDAG